MKKQNSGIYRTIDDYDKFNITEKKKLDFEDATYFKAKEEATDFILFNLLTEKQYITYKLNKKRYTQRAIGYTLGVGNTAISMRLNTIEKTIVKVIKQIDNKKELDFKIDELVIEDDKDEINYFTIKEEEDV